MDEDCANAIFPRSRIPGCPDPGLAEAECYGESFDLSGLCVYFGKDPQMCLADGAVLSFCEHRQGFHRCQKGNTQGENDKQRFLCLSDPGILAGVMMGH